MKTVFESRACAVLHNLLQARDDRRPFLLPANVCPVVPQTFQDAGSPFELIDIGGADLAMDEERSLERIARAPEGIAGLLFVRTYGTLGDAAPFFGTLKNLAPDLLVIDDRCLCPPDPDGGHLTPGADVTLWSTGYAKPVDVGFGGFAHLADGVPYHRRADAGRDGWLDLTPPEVTWPAYRAGVLAALPEIAEHKRRLNEIYTEGLPPEIQLPARFQGWRFHILVPEPDRLVESLFAAGLFASRHYAPLAEGFPEAEALHRQIVNLFNDRAFDEDRARRAVEVVRKHLEAGC